MKRSDIPDDHVIELARKWRDEPGEPGVVVALIAEGIPAKLALRKVEHLVARGLLDFGVSPNCAWPTASTPHREVPPPARWVFVESLADPAAPTAEEIAAGVELTGPIPASVWAAEPRPDALHFTIVHDPDIGTLAELTMPDGRRFYGSDPG